jgi:hypothetical protein
MLVSCGFIHYLVCRSGHLDILMMSATTISVCNLLSLDNVVGALTGLWAVQQTNCGSIPCAGKGSFYLLRRNNQSY